ncbi:Hypothetical predicted protein [Cloeon dipterum]|uniref:Uncharacterized protein n=1 Tax=Cloeon dipterum TaxID=197152 RepID=A0A8S1D4E3_9INSE|nr:Hypothetical predicted protein [Cloeon dipterum]
MSARQDQDARRRARGCLMVRLEALVGQIMTKRIRANQQQTAALTVALQTEWAKRRGDRNKGERVRQQQQPENNPLNRAGRKLPDARIDAESEGAMQASF